THQNQNEPFHRRQHIIASKRSPTNVSPENFPRRVCALRLVALRSLLPLPQEDNHAAPFLSAVLCLFTLPLRSCSASLRLCGERKQQVSCAIPPRTPWPKALRKLPSSTARAYRVLPSMLSEPASGPWRQLCVAKPAVRVVRAAFRGTKIGRAHV